MTKLQFKRFRINKLNLTQVELSIKLDLTSHTIQNYEYGNTPVPKVVEMACKYLMLRKV